MKITKKCLNYFKNIMFCIFLYSKKFKIEFSGKNCVSKIFKKKLNYFASYIIFTSKWSWFEQKLSHVCPLWWYDLHRRTCKCFINQFFFMFELIFNVALLPGVVVLEFSVLSCYFLDDKISQMCFWSTKHRSMNVKNLTRTAQMPFAVSTTYFSLL